MSIGAAFAAASRVLGDQPWPDETRRPMLYGARACAWQWSWPDPPRPPAVTDGPRGREATSGGGEQSPWDDGLRRLVAAGTTGPALAGDLTFSVLQLLPAELAHGILAIGRTEHGFPSGAAASEHALARGWRGFAVLPSRHVPPSPSASAGLEVHQDGL